MRDHPVHIPERRSAIRTGLYTGAVLTIVMLGGLVAANRVPALEPYALERNTVCYGLFFVVMMYPVVRFVNRPLRMFGAAVIGWAIFAGAYDISGIFFHNLFDVLRAPFVALVEGVVVYGLCAVVSWVGGMILHARRHSIAPGRRAESEATHHSR
ncbi:MAG TPA: hypothetical protein VJO53_08855 [Candidatus Acidoferrales bacterium]|nr:hypothetical protein [Candidatus Acidoferrales bacterium]